LLIKYVNKTYTKKGLVNINKIESNLRYGRTWIEDNNKKSIINIGVSLDPSYILKCMMTISSVIDSLKNDTKLRLHFGVVKNFSCDNMMKIYSLRDKLRDDVEYNFYNLKRVEIELKNIIIKHY